MQHDGEISTLLEISPGSIIAVVGCGGKTSLIKQLALQNNDTKVLVSTTTKMLPPGFDDAVLRDTLKRCTRHEPVTGIQYFGQLNEKSGKLEALPEHDLAGFTKNYDIVLLEADGSRLLPCKGWRDNEPVVPSYCTHTVGVLAMDVLGKAATREIVHNLPEFLSLTGLCEGEKITEQALVDMVCLPKGMFKGSMGQRFLVVNRVEGGAAVRVAKSFLQSIKAKRIGYFRKLVYGSVHNDIWQEV
jgi:probable selenium-dependent hydroxylase accessory protein YqeC